MENCSNQEEYCDDDHNERGQYSKYSKDSLQEAIEKIKNNEMSYGEASRIYGVPKTTLYNKKQNTHNSRRGATTTLTKDQEDELAEWVLKHQEFGDPRTKQDIIITASEIAELDDDSSNRFKNGLPTAGWVDGFLKRYPQIVYRKPESISKAAAINTKEDFSKLWRNIYAFLDKTNQLDLLHKPEHWWNADETSFPKDPMPRRVLARKGCKNVHRRERGPPKSNTTFTYAFSASGEFIEPLITLKDSASNIAEIAYACGSVNANFAINQTDSGWAQEDSFYHYVSTHLHKQWELKGSPKPRILVIDGYRAHLSVRLLRWGKLNDCIIIVLYPNGTPYIQMCDTTMFKPMKEKHIELYQQWRLKHPIGTSDDVVLVKLVKMVNDAVIREESIINGWRATGLQPFDFNNLKCDDLLSKSPDFVYDFKGHHINPSTTETSVIAGTSADSTLMLDKQLTVFRGIDGSPLAIYSNNYETFDATHELSIIQQHSDANIQVAGALSTQSHNDRDIKNNSSQSSDDHSMVVIQHDNFDQSSILFNESTMHELPAKQADCLEESSIFHETTVHELPVMHNECLQQSNIAYKDIVFIGENEGIDFTLIPNSKQPNIQRTEANVAINFSELNSQDKIFRSNVETSFNMSDFGVSVDSLSHTQSKLSKLTQKIRRDVKELALLCAANDKPKLINVLIINQQLNVIDPPDIPTEVPVDIPNETRTIKTILVPPTMPQRAKAKTHRNIKVGYGVATAEEVLEHIAEREILDGQLEIEKEETEIEKKAREKKIDDVEKQLQETRKLLMNLRSENTANVKAAAQQKKSKKRGNDASLDEIIAQKKLQIEAKNDELKDLREQLKLLKADHISANKAAAAKRKNDIQLKKERGNVVIPPQAHYD